MTFTKTANENIYRVVSGGDVVGSVRKCVNWTVRGKSTVWEAMRAGAYLGSYRSRYDAGACLVSRGA